MNIVILSMKRGMVNRKPTRNFVNSVGIFCGISGILAGLANFSILLLNMRGNWWIHVPCWWFTLFYCWISRYYWWILDFFCWNFPLLLLNFLILLLNYGDGLANLGGLLNGRLLLNTSISY